MREDLAGQAHAGAHLDPVLGMAHIVELNPRRLGRIGRPQAHGAAALRPHRPDMRLEAVLAGQRRAVIGDRHRQEMELNVGVANAGARADEAARLEMVGGAEAAPAHQPLGADERAPDEARVRKERDRLPGGDLKGEFEMVLQVLADAGPVGDHVDPERAQFRRRPHARQLQELRRIDRAAAKNDLAPRARLLLAPVAAVVDADRAAAVEGDSGRQRVGDHLEVGPLHRRPEIGVGGRPAHAVPHRHVERAKPLLPLAVEIGADRIARLPARLDEGVVERVAFAPMRRRKRSGVAAIGVSRPAKALRAAEVRQHVLVAPALGALLLPALEIERMPAHIDHAVDRGRTAENLAARTGDAPAAEMGLGLALDSPNCRSWSSSGSTAPPASG